jgi:L-ascorbate metabolism protein UlaG (beta-lactamase superfamily)
MGKLDLTYLGTACLRLEVAGLTLLTDPAFDPQGSKYDFGPWYTPRSWFASEKTYATPLALDALGSIDAVLLSPTPTTSTTKGASCSRAPASSE